MCHELVELAGVVSGGEAAGGGVLGDDALRLRELRVDAGELVHGRRDAEARHVRRQQLLVQRVRQHLRLAPPPQPQPPPPPRRPPRAAAAWPSRAAGAHGTPWGLPVLVLLLLIAKQARLWERKLSRLGSAAAYPRPKPREGVEYEV